MRMQNSVKELLHSLPIDVRFAGFKSNTLALAQAGWDLSMEQGLAPYGGHYELQLMMRLGDQTNAIYAVSHRQQVRMGDLAGGVQNAYQYSQLLASMCFEIQHISPGFQFKPIATTGGMSSFASRFDAIDPMPQERMVTEDIRDFKFFKIGNADVKDIICDPSKVPELLDLVLKSQARQIDDIKARERSRKNLEDYHNRHNTKPRQIHAQIITLAV